MNGVVAVMKRELAGYFATPIAYVFIWIFLVVSSLFAFNLGKLYERNQADLASLFTFSPWLFLFLVPPLSMRLWAEERKSGTVELLLTLPIEIWQAVLGKFLAAWLFTGLAIALTFPMWITVNYLGEPDNGVIVATYIGSFLMAGGFLAVGSCLSAATKNQVIALIFSVFTCMLLVAAGWELVLDFFSRWAPQALVDAIASLSFYTHFTSISKGVIDVRDLVYFALLIGVCLYANTIVLHLKKAD
ncbi:MAG TPA: ABC transporter permease [Gammaproteobacteria bacterium]|jgi:ABC-2 type transport system permease protein|nr:ABC transporter permease [Gammaproteobacteria bacterium]